MYRPGERDYLITSAVACGVSLLFFVHAIFDPRSTVSEFAGGLEGWAAVFGALISFSIIPAYEISRGKKIDGDEIRGGVSRIFDRYPRMISIILFSISLFMICISIFIRSIDTSFESGARKLLFSAHEERCDDTHEGLQSLKGLQRRLAYQNDIVELLEDALVVCKLGSGRAFSAKDLDRIKSSLRQWRQRNGFYFVDHVMLFEATVESAQGRPDLAALQLNELRRSGRAGSQLRLIIAFKIGNILLKKQEYESALEEFDRALSSDYILSNESKSIILRRRGICHAMLLNWEFAIADFQKILESADTSLPVVHSNLGFAFMGGRRFVEAERHFQEAIRLDPSDPVPILNLSIALAEQERFDEAREVLSVAWERTDKKTMTSDLASDAVLAKLVAAWMQIRENPDYTTGFIQYAREAKGLPPNNDAIAKIVQNSISAMNYHLETAERILQHQNLHGLEFMAADILTVASAKYPGFEGLDRFRRLERKIPVYAKRWRPT